jgi:hypothetical protein
MEKIAKYCGYAVLTMTMIIFLIPLNAIFGFLAGTVIKFIFGETVIRGVNLLFNTQRFHPNDLPYICSALGVISAYLRTTVTNKKD